MLEYEKGYFKALLDLSNYIDEHSESIKSLKQCKFTFIYNLIKYLLDSFERRELFRRYGGDVIVKINHDKDCKIVSIAEIYSKGDV